MDDINVLHRRCFLNLRRRIHDIGDGRPAQERYMRLQKDGDILSYQGNSEEVGCYVAGHPLSKGNCYFEVTIVDTGVRGTIAVGLVPKFYRLDHQPGWLPYSVAYHADNGKLYNGNPVGQQFGPKCARGDRIGCGIHSENTEAGLTTVFFTKNGKEVGSVEVPVSAEGLFPAVGMHSMGEEVKVDLQAEWFLEENDSMMMVDSHEDDWGRLYDIRPPPALPEPLPPRQTPDLPEPPPRPGLSGNPLSSRLPGCGRKNVQSSHSRQRLLCDRRLQSPQYRRRRHSSHLHLLGSQHTQRRLVNQGHHGDPEATSSREAALPSGARAPFQPVPVQPSTASGAVRPNGSGPSPVPEAVPPNSSGPLPVLEAVLPSSPEPSPVLEAALPSSAGPSPACKAVLPNGPDLCLSRGVTH